MIMSIYFIICSVFLTLLVQRSAEKDLDAALLNYMQSTFADSTKQTYRSHRKKYLDFCSSMGYSPVPVSTMTLCRYAVFLAKTLKFNSVKQYLNIVRILHIEWSLPNPLQENFQFSSLMKGIRRSLGDTPCRKFPITPQILLQMLPFLDFSSPLDSCVWAAALLMFFGMFRRANVLTTATSFDHAKHLRRSDIRFYSWGLSVHIRWTKTIQYKQRDLSIPVPRKPGHPLCPVQALFHALSLTKEASATGPLFVIPGSKRFTPLTPDKFVHYIRQLLSKLGLDAAGYAGHSFRRGGASWAFSCGVPIDLIRTIGDWQSNAYMAYLKPAPNLVLKSLDHMLSMSKS